MITPKRTISTLRGDRPDPMTFVIDHLETIENILAHGRIGKAHDLLKSLIAALNRETLEPGAA
jgi:hypothetical protein